MPRRNRKAGQPNREAQKNRHAYRVESQKWFRSDKDEEESEQEVKRA